MANRRSVIEATYKALQSSSRLTALLGHHPGATTYPAAKIIGEAVRVDLEPPLVQIGIGMEEPTASPKYHGDRRMQIYLTVYAHDVYQAADILDALEEAVQAYPSSPELVINRVEWGGSEGVDSAGGVIIARALVIVQWISG